jgi:hypothetical protein
MLRQRVKVKTRLSLFSFTRTRMRVSRGDFRYAVKCLLNLDAYPD